MIIRLKRSFLLAVLLLALPHFSLADAPNGSVTFSFSAEDAPVYDLSGGFQLDQIMFGAGNAEVALSYGINLTQDPRGFLSGTGQTIVGVGNDFVAAEYVAKGKISRGRDLTRVMLQVRLRGEDIIGGFTTPFSITIVYHFILNPESGTLEGTARGSARFGQLGTARIRSDVSASLPPGIDGAWALQMNILPLSRLVGSSQIVLSNGRTLQMHLNGSYSLRRDSSVIRISGFGDSRGNSATVIFNSDVISVRGRLFGQVVRVVKGLGE